MEHSARQYWYLTPDGNPAGYIQAQALEEVWFHTGTDCNLGCSGCLEGAGPGSERIESVTLEDLRPFIDEAVEQGVDQISFTGGEPFVNNQFLEILNYALERKPCLVLTNGTLALRDRMPKIRRLSKKANPCRFRVSLDFPDPQRHDDERGAGNFILALDSLSLLYHYGFGVSIARRITPGENQEFVNRAYRIYLEKAGLPLDTRIIAVPDLLKPGSRPETPAITENCMTTYHTEETRRQFMCACSRMVLKQDGRMAVYACPLVDDDENYNLGTTLAESLKIRVSLRHHRCFSCFSQGTSRSER